MKAAVIGAGTMGAGIAQVFAGSSIEGVYLCDRTDELAEAGKRKIQENMERLVLKGKEEQVTVEHILGKISTGQKEIGFDADIIIEAVAENMAVKRQVLREMDAICSRKTIFATNTSSLSVTALGEGLSHALVGMHFFNPVPVMELVELIAGVNTAEYTLEEADRIIRMIGKTPVKVKEAPGFIVNRMLIPMINEAISIYEEGTATVEDIDIAMRLGANHPMGPLALADLIGLDVVLAIMDVLLHETGDSKYKAASLLRKMVRGNKLGRKTGRGFYQY